MLSMIHRVTAAEPLLRSSLTAVIRSAIACRKPRALTKPATKSHGRLHFTDLPKCNWADRNGFGAGIQQNPD